MVRTSQQARLAVKKAPAPYGHACINCTRAKCRCMMSANGSCERCTRIGKECQPAQKVRKRNAESTVNRLSVVESKLDTLISTLHGNGLDIPLNPSSKWHSRVQGTAEDSNEAPDTPDASAVEETRHGRPLRIRSNDNFPPFFAFLKESEILDNFRRVNLQYLPFIHLPAHMTSEQLSREKPFLWQCIKAIYTFELSEREMAFATLRDKIHLKVIIEGSPDIDLLLGMMAFMSWKTHSRKPFLNMYNHLLIGTVSELELDKEDTTDHAPIRMFHREIELTPKTRPDITMEERRAVLGCFIISVSIMSMLGKGSCLRWTPWMDENLELLQKKKECPGDELLVTLVRIQLVVSKIYMFRRDKKHAGSATFALGFWRSQLDAVKSHISHSWQENNTVQIYLLNAELSVQELSFDAFTAQEFCEIDGFGALNTAVQTAKSLLDAWLRLPPEHYLGVSIIGFFHFNHGLMDLLKLSTLEYPGWAKGHVQSTANIRQYIDAGIANFHKSARKLSEVAEENMFEQTAKLFVALKQKWEPLLDGPWQHASSDRSPANMTLDDGFHSDSWIMEGLDNDWMAEFLKLH